MFMLKSVAAELNMEVSEDVRADIIAANIKPRIPEEKSEIVLKSQRTNTCIRFIDDDL